jgi:hypothetical protein
VEASKQVTKNDQKEHLKQEAQAQIAHANTFKQQIALVNAKKKNPWQAPPITHLETTFNRKERIIEEIQPQRLKISYKPHD